MTTFIVNELRVREREMEISNRKLEEQDRLKSRYVLTVSHDIQNSLSTIQNLLKVSLEGYAGSISQNMKETLSRAEARSSSLLRFVRDLLNLSSMRAEVEIKKGPLDLIEVIDQQVEILKAEMEKKKLSFEMKRALKNAIVNGNRIAMDQLFANLLSNAVKYTGRGGRITLTLEKSAVSGSVAISGSVQIEIADSGIGIPEENIPFIFEDFYRANNAKESEEIGTGLGLSIVKKIIETHGGKIRVDSQINRGTRFSLTLPLVGSEQ
jgi:signal transduction histidine kinase